MILNLFRRRQTPVAEQVRGMTPGDLGERNRVVIAMARKFVLGVVAANIGTMVLSVAMMDRLGESSKDYETFLSSLWISGIGLGVLVVIVLMFWASERIEGVAVELHRNAGGRRATPEVERHMAQAARLIQFGYRLALFVGVALLMAVIMAIRGLLSI